MADRSGFAKMMDEKESGTIGVCLCKDVSSLAGIICVSVCAWKLCGKTVCA
ncbi:MAG: hypothetical protein LBU32_20870 [Clostridiales bacterium]|nr:hypothetical protein [Clostridiales bacterium]